MSIIHTFVLRRVVTIPTSVTSLLQSNHRQGNHLQRACTTECSAIPYLVEDLDAGIEKNHAWGQHSGDLVEKGLGPVAHPAASIRFGLYQLQLGFKTSDKYRMHYQDRNFSFVIKAKK